MKTKSSPSHSVHIVEEKPSAHSPENLFNPSVDTSGVEERRLMRRIDWRLLPWLIVLYTLSFLDRTSIGNARVSSMALQQNKGAYLWWQLYNLEDDLKMSDNQYLLSLTVFFFSYAIFEVPSNIFLKRLRPSAWFSVLMSMWGLMMTLQGLRWMLGMFEAGLFPGMAYYLSCWYKRKELGIRIAILHCATTLAGAFGGLLAAISNMDGIGGKPAWAWIFIIEGLATIIAGISSIWVVQDFPDTAKFLTEAERTFVIRRLQGDDQFSASDKTGFRATVANLLVVPVYAFASIVTCCVALYADKHGRRGYCNITMLFIGAIGYIILAVSRNAALSYFAVFVATCGIFPVVPNTIAWVANNFEGSYKRGVSLAMAISIGNLNGAVSSNVYRARDQPWYPLGHGLVLMYICIGIIANATFLYLLKKENARRDRGERDELIGQMLGEDNGNGRFATVEDAKMEKGDLWSGYRYIL
ncbi:MFS domain-containing protein [Mycena venus]|uniref:MFS domain-containing protein n=1 Tax=Mycena venus TaxID=2733690 RepID=A0A8H6YD14_9AGAR|nr:MFS domain-containing protein [Mycena venus]